jgi:hypothetical protein
MTPADLIRYWCKYYYFDEFLSFSVLSSTFFTTSQCRTKDKCRSESLKLLIQIFNYSYATPRISAAAYAHTLEQHHQRPLQLVLLCFEQIVDILSL